MFFRVYFIVPLVSDAIPDRHLPAYVPGLADITDSVLAWSPPLIRRVGTARPLNPFERPKEPRHAIPAVLVIKIIMGSWPINMDRTHKKKMQTPGCTAPSD